MPDSLLGNRNEKNTFGKDFEMPVLLILLLVGSCIAKTAKLKYNR